MTNEEAIKKIKSLCHGCVEFPHCVNTDPDCFKALEIAIKVLSAEPCEDAISREELLKAIDTWDRFGVDDTNSLFRLDNLSLPHYVSYIHYDDVIKCIKGMPSIQPKPKTDEPMQVELEGDGYADGKIVYDYGKCPKCGWEFEYGDKDWEEPYCCHCGQRLKWSESEDEE